LSDLPEPIQQRLRSATRPAWIQVAPGKFIRNPCKDSKPSVGTPGAMTLAEWKENDDGTYSPLPFTEPMVRVTRDITRLLGFSGNWQTLARLAAAGFIEMIRIAPGTTLLNLNSYYNHLARCAEDSEFWDHGHGNFEEYKKHLF